MKSKEHILQSQVVTMLRKNSFVTLDCDVMSALRYLPARDKRRLMFINQHKSMGYTVGQADLVIISPKSKVFFVEMKNGKEGVQSKEQKWFERIVTSYGLTYLIWRTPEDVINFIKGEMADAKTQMECK